MKKLLLPVFAVSALFLNSCSTTQLARQADSGDDVYYTEARARVIEPAPVQEEPVQVQNRGAQNSREEQTYRTDEQLYGSNDYSTRDDYDRYDDEYYYSSRINRFYYNSPFRPYYDRFSYGYNPWYTAYDPFFYDPWMYRPGVSLWVNLGRHPRSFYNYGYYDRGYNGFWGPYSYYNTYPGYGYGYGYGRSYGGYYGNGSRYNLPSRPRPNREGNMNRGGDRIGSDNGGYVPSSGRPSRGSSTAGRERQGSDGRVSADPASGGSNTQPPQARPTRGGARTEDGGQSGDRVNAAPTETTRPAREARPTRTRESGETRQSAPPSRPAPEYSRPERTYSPPPSSSSGRSSDGGSSSGGSSGGGSSRPSRGGR